ncbi:MAG: FAD-dependent oxidoreductase [Patescibacteria group bacterium]
MIAVNKNKDLRIAIIGAGASGLTAGWELKNKGYKNVVIYEKESQVGGKTFSFPYKNKNFELGSMMFSRFDETAWLARHFKVPFQSFDTEKFYLANKKYVNPFRYARRYYSLPRILTALYHVKRIVAKNNFYDDDLAAVGSEFYENFGDFSRKNKIEPIVKLFEPAITCLGYGYFEETPAIYILKIMASMLDNSLFLSLLFNGRLTCYFPDGWITLWKKVAGELDVRLNSVMKEIRRESNGIKIILNGREEIFDRLIITVPLNKVGNFLDLDDREKELFAASRPNRLISTLVECSTSLPRSFFFADNAHADRIGHVLGIENYYPETNTVVLFQVVGSDIKANEINAMILKDFEEQLNCEVKEIVLQKDWEYFHHASSEDLRNGFYAKLYALQGEKNTFYLGGIFNFETVAHCEKYASHIVNKYF